MDAASEQEISRACERVALLASNFMDACEFERMVELFTEDCEFVRPSTFPTGLLKGRHGILELAKKRPNDLVSRHVCSNIVVSVISERKAVAHSYFLHFAGRRAPQALNAALPIENTLRSVGEYDDQFELTPAGWRIAKRVGRFVFGGI